PGSTTSYRPAARRSRTRATSSSSGPSANRGVLRASHSLGFTMLRSSRLVLAALVLALAAAGGASAYPWPIKPFNKQHPIRGFFGDPRTVFENGVLAGGFDGLGFFSFHQGIDISAPDGTPIYPVVSGI